MEALARRIVWPIQPAPFWKMAEPSRANKPLDTIGISDDAGVAIRMLGALNPGAFAKPNAKRSFSKQTVRSRRGARVRGQSILIVDDVADVTEMIALFLKHAGFEVTTANSADSALRLTADTHFDLIISDIGMPEMNGYELAESLRNRDDYSTTPLIAVTGYTEYDDLGRSLRAGFNAHLTKPINPSQLLEIVSKLLD
jgi:CheY-like chemotaxis protein